MLNRLLGLETEYAIRFSPRYPGDQPPPNDVVFEAIREAIAELVLTRPGALWERKQFFTENGGCFCYEAVPYAPAGGLVEGGTPECRGPSPALLYQKAQDALLCEALPIAEQTLFARGYAGTLGLLKNCRDADGHVYGAQENYEADLARGPALVAWRVGLACLLPAVAVSAIATWALIAASVVVLFAVMFALGLAGLVAPRLREAAVYRLLLGGAGDHGSRALEGRLARVLHGLERVLWEPVLFPFLLLVRAVGFRRIRRDALAFLVTRQVFTGAGSLDQIGSDAAGAREVFSLSEKAFAIRAVVRRSLAPNGRAVFEVGNLCKDLVGPMAFRVRGVARLFRRRQRLQLGLSDSNMAQVAEYLKVAITALVVDMAEDGALAGLPRPRRPLAALRAITRDPSLTGEVALRGGGTASALAIQRAYLERARAYVERADVASAEAAEVVSLWAELLDQLERDRDALIGRIDWVTKRWLLAATFGPDFEPRREGGVRGGAPDASGEAPGGERGGEPATPAARKKLDLRYHELGTGYFAMLERRGLAPRLVTDEELERARTTPPEASPAQLRSRIIRDLAANDARVRVSWREVQIGGPLRGKVIRLDDHRERDD